MAGKPHPLRDALTRLHGLLFRATRGRVGRSVRGAPVLVLETRGRKSGKVRSVPLLYVEDEGDWVVVASSGGDDDHPAWYLNVEAEPRVTVVTEAGRRDALAMHETGAERDRLFAALVAIHPSFEPYRRRTTRSCRSCACGRRARGPTPRRRGGRSARRARAPRPAGSAG